eukprot:m.82628 g.82628  ORF g.82628 m.82628 type:complete len:657 (-) comp8671_c0_seq1:998-2968(-)
MASAFQQFVLDLNQSLDSVGPFVSVVVVALVVLTWVLVSCCSGGKSAKDMKNSMSEFVQKRIQLKMERYENEGAKHTQIEMRKLREKMKSDVAFRQSYLSRVRPRTRLMLLRFLNGSEDISEQATKNKRGAFNFRQKYGGFKMPYEKDPQDASTWLGELVSWIPWNGIFTVIVSISMLFDEMQHFSIDEVLRGAIPKTELELDAWILLWAEMVLRLAVMANSFRVLFFIVGGIFSPWNLLKKIFFPFNTIVVPAFTNVNRALDECFQRGSIETHINGLVAFLKSICAIMTSPFNALFLLPLVYTIELAHYIFYSKYFLLYCLFFPLIILYLTNFPVPIDFNNSLFSAPVHLLGTELFAIYHSMAQSCLDYLHLPLNAILLGAFGHSIVYVSAFICITSCYSLLVAAATGGILSIVYLAGFGDTTLFGYAAFLFVGILPIVLGVLLAKMDVKPILRFSFPFLGAGVVAYAFYSCSYSSLISFANMPTILTNQFLAGAVVPSIGCMSDASLTMIETSSIIVQEFCVSLFCANVADLPGRSPYDSTPRLNLDFFVGKCTSNAVHLCEETGTGIIGLPYVRDMDCGASLRATLAILMATITFFLWKYGQEVMVKITTAAIGAFIVIPTLNGTFVVMFLMLIFVQSFVAEPLTDILLAFVE